MKPICLPVGGNAIDLAGKYAVVSGWGVTQYGKFQSSNFFKFSSYIFPTVYLIFLIHLLIS